MGCLLSGQVRPAGIAGGGGGGGGGQYQNKTLVDIPFPLTEREVITVTRSWKTISKNMINAGIVMFQRMFDTHADVKKMFEQFRTVDAAELWSNNSLENHALLVMNAIDETMANLDDPEYIVEMLLVTGKSHRRFENFSTVIFWAIEEPFNHAVRQTMLEKFSPTLDKLYRKTMRFILLVLIKGYEEDSTTASIIGGSTISRRGVAP